MRRFFGFVTSIAILGTATTTRASSSSSYSVPGTAAIFLAGRTDVTIAPPGFAPAGYPLVRNNPAGPSSESFPIDIGASSGQSFQFSATGTVDLDVPLNQVIAHADGAGYTTSILTVAGISGYQGPEGALVGVFETDTDPKNSTPPATINFSLAGGTSFSTLSPGLDQVFFIGDGLTGTGTGSLQSFVAPTGATQLYLGIVDVNPTDLAGYYDDNSGSFAVTVNSSAVPEPTIGTGALLGMFAGGMTRRKRKSIPTV